MKTNEKSKEELSRALLELEKENASLKALYEKDTLKEEFEEKKSFNTEIRYNSPINFAGDGLLLKDEHDLRQLLDDYLQMYATRDDRLTSIFSDDFSGFTGGGDFLVKDKNEWVAITRQDFAQVKDTIHIELKDVSIQSLSDTIAVATSFFIIHLPIKDHILSRETARLVLIFRKESASWKISHSSISIPYYLVREGEVYPMQELKERNQFLEELIDERTVQLSKANDNLQIINEELAKEIAEHKNAEEELQKSNQKLEAIISTSPDGIGTISFDGKLQLVSDRLVEMYGYSVNQKNEFIGKSAFDFIDTEYHEMLRDYMKKLLAGKSDHKVREYKVIKKDQSRFYIGINSAVLVDSEGNPSSILFVERDVTDRKQVELLIQDQNKQLKELNATKDKFFSILAHDLKSPFQAFMGITELLAEDITSFTPEELSDLTKGMNKSANNLYKLLSNLLEWAQMQDNSMSFKPEEILLSEIVTQNIDLVIKKGEQKKIDIITEIPKKQVVYADSDMLNSIFSNLLYNAVKFTNRGGKVIIRSKAIEDNMIQLSVEDNGIGMPGDIFKNLFKIDEKVGRKGTDGEESTGLGLLLCKEFVEKHGGKIWAESSENTGSIFYFTLNAKQL